MPRVVILGTSGAGKSTVAHALAHAYRLPHIDLDNLTTDTYPPVTSEAFVSRVREVVAQADWIIDGDYQGTLGDLVLSRAPAPAKSPPATRPSATPPTTTTGSPSAPSPPISGTPTLSSPPQVLGTAKVGEILAASSGSWERECHEIRRPVAAMHGKSVLPAFRRDGPNAEADLCRHRQTFTSRRHGDQRVRTCSRLLIKGVDQAVSRRVRGSSST